MATVTESKNPIEKCLSVLSPYQYFVIFLLSFSKMPMIWHILNLIFLSPPIDFYCNGTRSDAKNQCPCDNPWWDRSVFTETMQTKFGLYCDSSWLIHFSHSMNYLGTLIGGFIFGFLSDRFGRLVTFSLACITIALAGCLITITTTISSFICMRFLEGVGVGGGIVTSFVLCIEYCAVAHREVVTALFHIPINLGHLIMPGISYLLRHMDSFQIAISIPMLFFALAKCVIMESPKWLMDNNKVEQLSKGMKKICKNSENIKEDIHTFLAVREASNAVKIKFWEIFKHKGLALNFVCMAIIYFVCGMGYYGVSQFIGAMAGNIHLNVSLSGLLTLPGTLSCVCLLGLFSRRNFLMVSNFLSGVFMIAVVCTPTSTNYLRITFACVANCFFFTSFIIAFLYGVELFPTSVRNSVLGILSVLSRVGQIVAPPINSLSETAAGATFGFMAIMGAFACLPLPETKNTELPSTLQDIKEINKKRLSRVLDNDNVNAGSSTNPTK